MKLFWSILYNALLPLFRLALRILAWFNPKVRKGIEAREGLFERLTADAAALKARRRVWVHSSSMGEFEQAKPIIAALRKRYNDIDIIVSFFSPSGYEPSKNYKLASLVTYIPYDSRSNARRFLDIVKPDLTILIRYDLWPNHIWEMKRRGIPIVIASAAMGKRSSRRNPLLHGFYRSFYECIAAIMTVSPDQIEGYRELGLRTPLLVSIGETRYDQVWNRSNEAKTKRLIPESLLANKHVLVIGSSWSEDEAVLLPAVRRLLHEFPDFLVILVPHEPTEPTLARLEAELEAETTLRFSALASYADERVLLVDSIGNLMTLYHYAAFAYVGGSFRQGIHNVLEPAAYGIPVLFGPKHDNAPEPAELVRRGGARVVTTTAECYEACRQFLESEELRSRCGTASFELVKENIGATDRCLEILSRYLPTT